MDYSSSLETVVTPNNDQPAASHVYEHTQYSEPVQPELANNINEPVQPEWATNFNQPVQPQWVSNFNQPTQFQGTSSYPPGNVPKVSSAPGNNKVMTTQPMVFMAPVQQRIPDYQVYSIFTMLFCCFPIGLAACIFSTKTKNANLSNNAEGARRFSRKALTLNHVALVIGIVVASTYISFLIYYFTARSSHSSSYPCYSYYAHPYYC